MAQMKVYAIGLVLHGVAYVRANSATDAKRRVNDRLRNTTITVDGDNICDLMPESPALPDFSLAPEITIVEMEAGDIPELRYDPFATPD